MKHRWAVDRSKLGYQQRWRVEVLPLVPGWAVTFAALYETSLLRAILYFRWTRYGHLEH